jgi:hypothetical protein
VDDTLERGTLPPQLLGPFRVVPDAGLGQFQFYLGQTLFALVEVKDTP